MWKPVAGVVVMVVLFVGGVEAVPKSGQREFPGEIACEDSVLEQAWELLASAQFGRSRREHAAFIVRGTDGTLALDRWPFAAESARATFRGRVPSGTVAIIHTHPNELEYPSVGDRRLAGRLELPVYVVTRTRISKTDGEAIESIWSGDWNPRDAGRTARSRCGEGSVAMAAASLTENR